MLEDIIGIKDLWREIVRRSNLATTTLVVAKVTNAEELSKAEVTDGEMACGGDEDVVGFKVAVDDFCALQLLHADDEFCDVMTDVLQGHTPGEFSHEL